MKGFYQKNMDKLELLILKDNHGNPFWNLKSHFITVFSLYSTPFTHWEPWVYIILHRGGYFRGVNPPPTFSSGEINHYLGAP